MSYQYPIHTYSREFRERMADRLAESLKLAESDEVIWRNNAAESYQTWLHDATILRDRVKDVARLRRELAEVTDTLAGAETAPHEDTSYAQEVA